VVRLAVLIDRGGRELPIAADFVGQRILATEGTRVQVRLRENDDTEGVYLVEWKD
jgi:pyrimidine operon attenuation protein/uracil phosphoribosyltransferase